MGPSGAGKSTLLSALMGTANWGATKGQVWVNNRAIPLRRLRRIMGYVPQVSHVYFPIFMAIGEVQSMVGDGA